MTPTVSTSSSLDALLPADMAKRAEEIGVKKTQADLLTVFVLAILAGAFISLGAIFSTVATADSSHQLGYGLTKMLGGLAFCLGLILVVIGGAELFTGNNLIIMACVSRRVSLNDLLTNWGLVYTGNFIGALGTVLLVFLSKHYTFGGGAVGRQALTLAAAKCDYTFVQAVALGILCNALVCLAVWLTYSARTTSDKVLAIIFPVAAFVAAGFEHSVANMYFIPLGLMIKAFDSAWVAANAPGIDLSALTTTRFLFNNLLPVTIGNIIGGAALVGSTYWFVYLRPQREASALRRRAARTSPQR